MNKKSRLIAGLTLLPLAFAAGYAAGVLFTPGIPAQTANANQAPALALSPRFSLELKNKIIESGLDANKLDSFLKRCSTLTPEQWEKEMTRLCNLPDKTSALFASILAYKWGQTSPKQALERIPFSEKTLSIYSSIIRGWAETNPEMAAAYFSEHRKDLPLAKSFLEIIAEEMAGAYPEKALTWFTGLDEEGQEATRYGIVAGIAKAHPEQLPRFISQLPPQELQKNDMICYLASEWAEHDWLSANQWINSLPADKQEEARNVALGALSVQDPGKATEEFKKLNASAQEAAADTIASALSQKSLIQALEWLNTNTPEEIAVKNVNNLFSSSPRVPALNEYVTRLPDGAFKDAALSSLISMSYADSRSSFVNFEETIKLADGIQDSRKKEKSISTALSNWGFHDPEEARAWVRASDQAEPVKQSQLKELELFKSREE